MVDPTILAVMNMSMPSCFYRIALAPLCRPVHHYTKECHSNLPSSPPVRRSLCVFIFLIFQKMRLALKSKTDTLYASRHQAHKDAELHGSIC